jgi:hypothetical protein
MAKVLCVNYISNIIGVSESYFIYNYFDEEKMGEYWYFLVKRISPENTIEKRPA